MLDILANLFSDYSREDLPDKREWFKLYDAVEDALLCAPLPKEVTCQEEVFVNHERELRGVPCEIHWFTVLIKTEHMTHNEILNMKHKLADKASIARRSELY